MADMTDAERTEREKMIAGYRELADALEQNPDMPHPGGTIMVFASLSKREGESPVEFMARSARGIPGKVEKSATGDAFFSLSRRFGGLRFEVHADRDEVCTRKQVGTRVETVVETVETKEVEREVAVYEWDCKPVLSKAVATDEGDA